ncbi:MAG: hypothetical protein ACLTJB_00015 [Holdemania filiformis]
MPMKSSRLPSPSDCPVSLCWAIQRRCRLGRRYVSGCAFAPLPGGARGLRVAIYGMFIAIVAPVARQLKSMASS